MRYNTLLALGGERLGTARRADARPAPDRVITLPLQLGDPALFSFSFLFFSCPFYITRQFFVQVKGALQLLMNRYGSICFAPVHERVSIKSFVVLIRRNSNSNHLCVQGTFNPNPLGL